MTLYCRHHYRYGGRIMMTSSNGNIFRVTGPLCGEFTGPGEFPAQRPVTRSFDVFFDLRPNKRLSKQLWGWWFETLSWSLWRHCNVSIRVWNHIRHPIFRPNGRAMGFLSWIFWRNLAALKRNHTVLADIVNSRSSEFVYYYDCIALKFKRHFSIYWNDTPRETQLNCQPFFLENAFENFVCNMPMHSIVNIQ